MPSILHCAASLRVALPRTIALRAAHLLATTLVAAAWCGAPAAHSHPPSEAGGDHNHHHHSHAPEVWRNAVTGRIFRGDYLASNGLVLSIEQDDEQVVHLPLAELVPEDRARAEARMAAVQALNERALVQAATPSQAGASPQSGAPLLDAPLQAAPFQAFAPAVRTRWDSQWLYVESDGMPHDPFTYPLMVGIRSWQQQVPLPQDYTGANAWRIPLKPELADKPISGRTQLYRGAIALAANGVPIFNALNNRGDDAFKVGELDEYGGHSGRADDYHYHIAPLALQRVLGPDKPIAYALDGFALYGLYDPQAADSQALACPLGSHEPLDELNGHFAPAPKGAPPGTRGVYHYHASKEYPYINGGVRGKVTVRDDQIEPQPRAQPVRQWLQPLRGAVITGFKQTGDAAWSLNYALDGKTHTVNYRKDGSKVVFDLVDPAGKTTTETYTQRKGGERGPEGQRGQPPATGFSLSSAGADPQGRLQVAYTCDAPDGKAAVLPLAWANPPAGTVSYAVTMHHDPPPGGAGGQDGRHVYMVRWGLPASLHALGSTDTNVGAWGANTMNGQAVYAPPCSQGPGVKRYVVTLYALSALPTVRPASGKQATMDDLLTAVKGCTLTMTTLELQVERQPNAQGQQQGGDRKPLLQRMTDFHLDVPAHPVDLILTRPTLDSITASVLSYADGPRTARITYGPGASADTLGAAARTTPPVTLKPDEPAAMVMAGLQPDTAYAYRLVVDGPAPASLDGRFHTPQPAGAGEKGSFTFVIQADSHLDANMSPAVYERTLANMVSDPAAPEFLVDLGDTFMVDKRRDYHDAAPQYLSQRWYLGEVGRYMPVFMVLGNHDGEVGYNPEMSAWSHARRTKYFPQPDSVSGREQGDYYTFTWGDVQCIVLDPFVATTQRARGGPGGGNGNRANADDPNTDENWARTLGRQQYDWLTRTLDESKARYIFVFIHHLVGGLGQANRGGVEASRFFEWGGANADGTPGFAAHRPGWAMPIHDLLAKHHVAAVFHGHDHLYVHNERDGVTYQCVPQPGNADGGTRSAEEYGYAAGTIMGSPGHMRVRVEPQKAKVDYVRSALPQQPDGAAQERPRRKRGEQGARNTEANGAVVATYDLKPRTDPPAAANSTPVPSKSAPPKAAAPAQPATPPKASGQPNFVVVLGEGLGWSCTSVAMDPAVLDEPPVPGLTPNLERLAARGMVFSDFYVSAPRCTPSRASFLTGISAAKLHMTYVSESGSERRGQEEPLLQRMIAPPSEREMPAGVRTIAEWLAPWGYSTAHFGKWHVGRTDPTQHGFQVSDGPNTNVGPGGNREPNPEEGAAITTKGLDFMAQCAKAGKPFYLQMSHYGAGTEAEATPEALAQVRALLEKTGARGLRDKDLVRLAAMRDLDNAVGQVLAKLDTLGLTQRTYVFFSTDHGAPGGQGRNNRAAITNEPLSGGKGSVLEGGIRVPFIVAGPGVAAGVRCDARVSCMDLLPTVADLAGHPIVVPAAAANDQQSVEGVSLAPLFAGCTEGARSVHQALVVHYPHYDLGNGGPASAIFQGNYKLIRNDDTGARVLYDIQRDPRERTDLASQLPEQVKAMEQALDQYLVAIKAPKATPREQPVKP